MCGQTALSEVLLTPGAASLPDRVCSPGHGRRLKRDQVLLVPRLAASVRLSPCLTDREREASTGLLSPVLPTLPTAGQKERAGISCSNTFLTPTLYNFPNWIDKPWLFPTLPPCFSFHFQSRPGPQLLLEKWENQAIW